MQQRDGLQDVAITICAKKNLQRLTNMIDKIGLGWRSAFRIRGANVRFAQVLGQIDDENLVGRKLAQLLEIQ